VPSEGSHTNIETDWAGVRGSEKGPRSPAMYESDEAREEEGEEEVVRRSAGDSVGVGWEVTEGSPRSAKDPESGVS
jgi:hypothetical protein